jgi:hypothetical protein
MDVYTVFTIGVCRRDRLGAAFSSRKPLFTLAPLGHSICENGLAQQPGAYQLRLDGDPLL